MGVELKTRLEGALVLRCPPLNYPLIAQRIPIESCVFSSHLFVGDQAC